MSRDWDKLRRQDKARKPDLLLSQKPKHFRRYKSKKLTVSPSFKSPPRDCEKVLNIYVPTIGIGILFSRWHRIKGIWKCVAADDPIEWFLRVRHLDIVANWIFKKRYRYAWSKAFPIRKNPLTAKRTSGEKHSESCAEKGHGGASLNIPNPADLRGPTPQSTSGLEQNGYTNPHCLIATDCTVEPEIRSTRC